MQTLHHLNAPPDHSHVAEFQYLRHASQDMVNCVMLISVIDRIELVDIQHCYRHRPLQPVMSAEFILRDFDEMPTVCEAGKLICTRVCLQMLACRVELSYTQDG